MKLHLIDLKDEQGNRVGEGEAVVRVQTMRGRKILPVAEVKQGEELKLRLRDWREVEEENNTVMTGTIAPVEVELQKPHYWGEPLE